MSNIWLPVLIGAVGFVLTLAVVFVPRQLAMKAVAAVYRASLSVAEDCGGLEWLKSPEGVAYRKLLVRRVYALAPSPVVPWKLFVSEEAFCALVEVAFVRMLVLATTLAASDASPVAPVATETPNE